MSSSPSATRSRPAWLDTLVLAGVTALLTVAATRVMFSAFMFYDDEGYVLMSLRNFAEHGGLYRDVYTQYGPFPFVAYSALHALGVPLTHTVGRVITLGAWAGTALAAAWLTGYVTRQLALRLLVLAATFVYLWVMANEPSHPGGLVVLLTAVLAAAGHRWIATDQTPRWAVAVGAVTAALVMTKINVGAFLGFSAVCWWLLHHANPGMRRWALPLTLVLGVALPFALMRPLLGAAWVQTYAVVFACSAAALLLTVASHATGRVSGTALARGLVAGVVVTAVVVGVVLARGTSPYDLLDGLLLGPLRHPGSFSLRYLWPPGIIAITVLSLAGCLAARALRHRRAAQVARVVALLRLALAVALAVTVVRYPFVRPDYAAFGVVLPCLWLFTWPLGRETPAASGARSWVALVLLGQCLHVFPVPGSQIAWGSVLLVPMAAIGAWEAVLFFASQPRFGWLAGRGARLAGHALVFGCFALTTWKFSTVAERYRDGQDLRLPGAETIRLPEPSTALFRVLTANAAVHADLLFSEPGMFSLNLWTDLPTPTRANVTHWFSLLDATRQQAIIDRLAAHPRAAVIVDRGHVEFLAQHGLAPRGLLHDYLEKEFEPAFAVDRLEFRVHRGRTIQPFLLADLLARQPGADASAQASTLLRFHTLLPTSAPVARIEVAAAGGPLALHAGNARVEIAPVNARGEIAGPPRAAPWPFTLNGPSVVSIFYEREGQPSPAGGATFTLQSGDGAEVMLGRLRQ